MVKPVCGKLKPGDIKCATPLLQKGQALRLITLACFWHAFWLHPMLPRAEGKGLGILIAAIF